MAKPITENPAWIKKMKARFAALDVDKNGVVDKDDVALLAKNLAAYRKEDEEAEKRYFDTLNSVWSFGIRGGVREDEFVEGMKKFVTQADARERVNAYGKMVFEVVDEDKNGVLSLDEFLHFHKAAATNIQEEQIKRSFYDADTNGDGVIQLSEFQESIAKFMLSSD